MTRSVMIVGSRERSTGGRTSLWLHVSAGSLHATCSVTYQSVRDSRCVGAVESQSLMKILVIIRTLHMHRLCKTVDFAAASAV